MIAFRLLDRLAAPSSTPLLASAGLLVTAWLASACVIPIPVGDGADDVGSGDAGETEPGASSNDGATAMDDAASETDGAAQYPDCTPPSAADVSLALTVDGVLYDPWMPPQDLLYAVDGPCMVTSALGTELALECPDTTGELRAIELTIEATPSVALPATGAMVYANYYLETDDLSDRLGGWSMSLRDGTADGPLLLALNGAFSLVFYGLEGLEASVGPEDVCPHQEIDTASCEAYRRTWVTVEVDGTELEAFDATSIDAGGLRMVVGDAAFRTASPDLTNCGGGLGPGLGRFELVIGPPA